MNVSMSRKGSHRRRTKIIATLGPGTDDPAILEGMIRAGVDVFRLNMSHGDAELQERRARMVREAARKLRWQVAILVDLQGPKIRIEKFENGFVELTGGDHFMLDTEHPEKPGDDRRVGVSYPDLHKDVEVGDTLLLDDGLISMQVQAVRGGQVYCLVENGGTLLDRSLIQYGSGLGDGNRHNHDDLPILLIGVASLLLHLGVVVTPPASMICQLASSPTNSRQGATGPRSK